MKGQSLLLVLAATRATARQCRNVTISVDISARNAVFDLAPPATTIETIEFFQNVARQGHNYTNELLTGYTTVTKKYQIGATLCTPDHSRSTTLQLLTHGISLDRSYWDLPFANHNNSYVAAAVDTHGYSTLAWDLLGIGGSSRGDPVNELQTNLQNAALHALTLKLRSGTAIRGVPAFRKVVHVGHSYGSVQTYTLAVRHPEVSDGLVLTGFSHYTAGIALFQMGADFGVASAVRADLAGYAPGYFAAAGVTGVQTAFFAPGNFDGEVLRYVFDTQAPAAVGEILTLAGDAGVVSPFTGPVLVITGDRDLAFCAGDCSVTGNASLPSVLELSRPMIPHANPLQTFVVPNTGHALNAEYTHPLTYKTILDFVSQHVKP